MSSRNKINKNDNNASSSSSSRNNKKSSSKNKGPTNNSNDESQSYSSSSSTTSSFVSKKKNASASSTSTATSTSCPCADFNNVRIALFTDTTFALKTIGSVIYQRPDTQLVCVVTCPGPKSRRSDAYLKVVQQCPPKVDVLVSNKRSKYVPFIQSYNVDLVLCLGYPWLLPKFESTATKKSFLKYGAINIHNSKLPKYRGPNAFAWGIYNGEEELGITAHYMTQEFDKGNVLVTDSIPLQLNDSISDIQSKIGPKVCQVVNEAITRAIQGDKGQEQDESKATYAPQFTMKFRWIDFEKDTALQVHNKIRAYYGGRDLPLGALATIDGKVYCLQRTFYNQEDENNNGNDTTVAAAGATTATTKSNNNKPKPGTIISERSSEDSFYLQCLDTPLLVLKWEVVEDEQD